MFSCKIHIGKNEEEDEGFRKRLNDILPEDVRVFNIVRCTNRFNAKLSADDREYSYYLPTFTLRSIKLGWYGVGLNRKLQAGEASEETKTEEVKKP